jgi:hypothetical protein
VTKFYFGARTIVRYFNVMNEITKLCPHCHNHFRTEITDKIYCSEKCKEAEKRARWTANNPEKVKERRRAAVQRRNQRCPGWETEAKRKYREKYPEKYAEARRKECAAARLRPKKPTIKKPPKEYSITCSCCGLVAIKNYPSTYCSKKCSTKAYNRMRKTRRPAKPIIITEHKCPICLNIFTSPTARTVYCSKKCKKRSGRQRHYKKHRNSINEKLRSRPRPPATEKSRATQRSYRKKHPEISRVKRHKRRMKQNNSTKDTSAIIRKSIMKAKSVCYWCGSSLSGKKWHMDHVVPLCRGGDHSAANVVKSCPDCNQKKGGKMPNDFIQEGQLVLL